MSRKIFSLNRGWKFHRGDIPGDEAVHNFGCRGTNAGIINGPAGKNYGDAMWRTVNVPHDYVNEGPFAEEYDMMHGYRERPNAWYRKSFTLDESFADKQLMLVFEGINIHCEVYFNGSLIERSFNGFQEIWVDITPRAYTDGKVNTLSVYVKSDPKQLWSYEGGGIYRNVWLCAKETMHIARDGVYVKPILKDEKENIWSVEVETEIENSAYTDNSADLWVEFSYKGERVVEKHMGCVDVSADTSRVVKYSFDINSPRLWDVENPELYDVSVFLKKEDVELDRETVSTGFRTFYVDVNEGFFLNGKRVQINGVCCHQDHACVGIAVPDNLVKYRISRIKAMGANAYRCSHHMMSRAVYDECDKQGLIVCDENRFLETRKDNLDALRAQVRRNRNHPSIVFWSLFNEEPLQNTEEGAAIYRKLKSEVKKLDDQRLCTGSMNGASLEGAGCEMDISGKNYGLGQIEAWHRDFPNQPMFGSENLSANQTRGCVKTDHSAYRCADLDTDKIGWGSTVQEHWNATHDKKWFAGTFFWTGLDYRGESAPFNWPAVSSQYGILDTCGFEKNEFYFVKSIFTQEPMVKIVPHWNHQKGETVRVFAVNNCQEAELFLNGKSLGKKPGNRGSQPCWEVEYEPGELCAKAMNNGVVVAEDRVVTATEATAIKIMPGTETVKNNGLDVAILNVAVIDDNGVIVPDACNTISFEVEGDGEFLGAGNGDPICHELDSNLTHSVFNGLAQVIVGVIPGAKELKLLAKGEGLKTAEYCVKFEDCSDVCFLKSVQNQNIGGFTMSLVSPERPDPKMIIDENDVNSFMPMDIPIRGYQKDFFGGYRMYRSVFVLPNLDNNSDVYTVEIGSACYVDIEIFVNGQKVFCDYSEKWAKSNPVRFSFNGNAGESIELRIIISYPFEENCAGISQYVKFITE